MRTVSSRARGVRIGNDSLDLRPFVFVPGRSYHGWMKILRVSLIVACMFALTSCASGEKSSTESTDTEYKPKTSAEIKPLPSRAAERTEEESKAKVEAPVEVPEEVSLKKDREELEIERGDIPENVKKSNDELALVLWVMEKGDEDPNKVRDRFDKALRDKRTKNDKRLAKKREDFTKPERKKRELFLKELKAKRDEFLKKKRDPDERKDFFQEQDEERKEFFAEEKDVRKEFESEMMEERKTFEDYVREKQNAFRQDLKAYSDKYYERRKQLDLKKKMDDKAKDIEKKKAREEGAAAANAESDEFKSMPKPNTPLGAGGDGK
jgi:hypothetical protein